MKYLTILIVLFMVSCNNNKTIQNHEHESEDGHEEHSEEVTYNVTLFSNNFEMFLEYSPLVENEVSFFIAHFTLLDGSYKPLKDGKVTFTLETGTAKVTSVGKPEEVNGIYKANIKIPDISKANLTIHVENNNIIDSFKLSNLNVYHDEHDAKPNEIEIPNIITFLKEQSWKTEFNVEQVQKKSFSSVIKVSGQINSSIGDESMIVAPVSGRVKVLNPTLLIGSAVSKGSNVFSISTEDFGEGNLKIRLNEAKINFSKAKEDLFRSEELIKDNIISKKEYLAIKAEFDKSESVLKTLSNDINGGTKNVKAPISGYFKKIYIHDGDYVAQGQVIASVSKNQMLILSCDLPPNFSNKITDIYDANFITLNDNKIYSVSELKGRKAGFGKSTDNLSFYIPIYFEFINNGNFIPGTYTEVYLKTKEINDALIIPYSSLTEESGIFYVYVQVGGESYLKREVTVGESDGIRIVVKNGLNEGERIVSRGAIQVKMASNSASIPHGHAH